MCQATVYLAQDGQEKELMRDVVLLEPVQDGLLLQASSKSRSLSGPVSSASIF